MNRLSLFSNDGAGYLNREGPVRASVVLNNMIAAGEIAPTVGVFLNPGQPVASNGPSNQRSYEYDSVTPDCGSFTNIRVVTTSRI